MQSVLTDMYPILLDIFIILMTASDDLVAYSAFLSLMDILNP